MRSRSVSAKTRRVAADVGGRWDGDTRRLETGQRRATMAESRPSVGAQQGRHEKSLGRLTGKFVSLLREAKDGVLDLKMAADCLAVRQKRRIYDITNVLEGVGLIEKKNKNIIQWRGNALSSHSQEVQEQVDALKAQISELDSQERELDRQKAWLEQSIEHMRHDPVTSTYAFVKYEDVYSTFNGDNLLAIVSPIGTQLEVPMPETDQSSWRKYQLTLRSQSGPIQVVMITNGSDPSWPVVFAVPPVDYISTLLTPPNTPADLHKFPTPSSSASSSFSHGTSGISSSSSCGQEPLCPDHQMAAADREGTLTPTSTPPDVQMECPGQSAAVVVQQMVVAQQDFQSILDVGGLMMINAAGDGMKEEREGVAELLEELMSSEGVDYNFNLEDDEGACDLFDVQVLNF